MSWLEKITSFRKGDIALAEPDEDVNRGPRAEDSAPALMCLVSDASGRASFKTHTFTDAESATDFVLYWFPNHRNGGIISFWAMTREPECGLDDPAETAAEPVALIRDVKRDGVVYLFSFSDIESAQSFLRQEVQHGTDLGSMMLYWAVPVRIEVDAAGRMMMIPSVPPGVTGDSDWRAPASDGWSVSPPPRPKFEEPRPEPVVDSRAAFVEAPNARTGVSEEFGGADETFGLTAWMEKASKKVSTKRAKASDVDSAASESLSYIRRPRPEPKAGPVAATKGAEPESEATEVVAEPEPASVVGEAGDETLEAAVEIAGDEAEAEIEAVEIAAEPDESMAAEEITGVSAGDAVDVPEDQQPVSEEVSVAEIVSSATDKQTDEPETEETPEVHAERHVAEREAPVHEGTVSVSRNGNGHKARRNGARVNGKTRPSLDAEVVIHENGHASDEPIDAADSDNASEPSMQSDEANGANGRFDQDVDIRIDIHLRSSRAMNVKRWEIKEEPFEGFNSPPGRF